MLTFVFISFLTESKNSIFAKFELLCYKTEIITAITLLMRTGMEKQWKTEPMLSGASVNIKHVSDAFLFLVRILHIYLSDVAHIR